MWVWAGRLSRLSAIQATIPLENWLLQGEVCEHCSSPGQAKVRDDSSKQLDGSKFQASPLGLNSKMRQNVILEERMGRQCHFNMSPAGWMWEASAERRDGLTRSGSSGEAQGPCPQRVSGTCPQCFLRRSSHQSKWDARIYLSPAPTPRLETH